MAHNPMTVGDVVKKLQGVDWSLPIYLQCTDSEFECDFMQVVGVEVNDIKDVFHSEYDEENPITFPALCLLYD